MARQPSEERNSDSEFHEPARLRSAIAASVIQALGKPVALYGVQVRSLWADHYRVNVLIGADAASALVAHSYFVMTDSRGGIIESTPEITRLY